VSAQNVRESAVDGLGPLADATPLEALGRAEMSLEEHFRRDHFAAPPLSRDEWSLVVEGAVRRPLRVEAEDLRGLAGSRVRCVLQCAGNRRTEQRPRVPGVPWGAGAVGELIWEGTSLAGLLRRAGVLPGATAVVLEGADHGEVPTGGVQHFARALPIAKALAGDVVLADRVAGDAVPVARGGPVRAIVPGWYATDSVKWLTRLTVVSGPFLGYFEAVDYRLAPLGSSQRGTRMCALPPQAQLTSLADGDRVRAGAVELAGAAWTGGAPIRAVEVRVDGGAWAATTLGPERGAHARRFWRRTWRLAAGVHTVEARAIDATGATQPTDLTPTCGGYGNDSVHRVDVTAC
jgi:DMSO/TMAO reductase YedYZ molybdopterin-dependent catalytic subunit